MNVTLATVVSCLLFGLASTSPSPSGRDEKLGGFFLHGIGLGALFGKFHGFGKRAHEGYGTAHGHESQGYGIAHGHDSQGYGTAHGHESQGYGTAHGHESHGYGTAHGHESQGYGTAHGHESQGYGTAHGHESQGYGTAHGHESQGYGTAHGHESHNGASHDFHRNEQVAVVPNTHHHGKHRVYVGRHIATHGAYHKRH